MSPSDRSNVVNPPRKLELSVETVRLLGGRDEKGPMAFTQPTTTVNTLKSGCC